MTLRRLGKLAKWMLFVLALVAVGLLLSAPFYLYGRFNAERPVAELWFERQGPDRYLAHVATGDLCTTRTYEISGDQWQLDAMFVKWKGVAVMLGFDSLYRLDRLSGRYADVNRQNALKPQSHELAPRLFLDFFPASRASGAAGVLMDTTFGSSVYLDIDTHSKYRVYRTEDALVAKQVGSPGTPVGGPLKVVVDKACGEKETLVKRLATGLNDLALAWLR